MAVMGSRTTDAPVSLGEYVPTADRVVVMRGITWEGFETLLALRGERSRPKLAYLDGEVELMTTSREHEGIKSNVGCFVDAYCLERGIKFAKYGNWTLTDNVAHSGIEPDECYAFGHSPSQKARPDLAIEVVWTSGGIDKLEAYRRLQIGEVWFWQAELLTPFVLGASGYERRARSECLPELDLALVSRLAQLDTSDAVVAFLATLRAHS
ncbi:MAG: Uma2 family endonuclease [Kofleriaceae bacterium]